MIYQSNLLDDGDDSGSQFALEFGTYLSPRKELLARWGAYEQHDSPLYRGELRRGYFALPLFRSWAAFLKKNGDP